MPKRRKSSSVERAGVNYIRGLFEGANCIYQEISKDNDVGHDAIVQMVEDEDC
jgi:hypothetical protein